MKKSIFLSKSGDVHIGTIAIEGYMPVEKTEMENVIIRTKLKKFWRCHVCNDLYIGKNPPKICPTCKEKEAYVEINEKEFRSFLEIFFQRSLRPGLMDNRIPLPRSHA